MNTILEGPCAKMPFYTDMREVLASIGHREREFNWLVTGCEVVVGDPTATYTPFSLLDAAWLTGDELSARVAAHPAQFVWGVFSGFPPTVLVDLQRLAVHPRPDGNMSLWGPDPQMQYPGAEVEVICYDSSATLLLCRNDTLGRSFRSYFPEAIDLNEYNSERLRVS
jgi:hypothetical protein